MSAKRRGIAAPPAGTPFGVWLVAGTPVNQPYPCRCWLGKRCKPPSDKAAPCPCWGRTDHQHLPPHCCAQRTRPAKEDQG